jgi:hypothetical protein
VSCTATGLANETVSGDITNGVFDHFFRKGAPDPTTPWVPSGWVQFADIPTGADLHGANIDVLGIFLATDGSLKVILNPEPVEPVNAGALRQVIAQARIDALTGN